VCSTRTSSANLPSPRDLPAVDVLLRGALAGELVREHGQGLVVRHARALLDELRAQLRGAGDPACTSIEPDVLDAELARRVGASMSSALRPIVNLTGTVVHTNLGRSLLPEAAIGRVASLMAAPTNLEYDLETGSRGDRDSIVENLLCTLTGAEAATVVNNNAAAVLLTIFALARGREVVISRGELVEIGGAFRMPDIMRSAGAKLVEIGTTNRTHLRDYAGAIGPKTGLILKVHTSNYRIEGFVAEVAAREISVLAHQQQVPLVNDLGSGTFVDLARFGLAHEPTVAETVRDGADLVTFSGDKLLGGPQAGFIVGRQDLIGRINKNPMKRALRLDKVRLAAVEATLKLYRDPDRLAERLPTMRLLARPLEQIARLAHRLAPHVAAKVGAGYEVAAIDCASQIGSGALPLESIASTGLAIRPQAGRGRGRALNALTTAFRALPVPVIGRIADEALIFDLRCLEDEAGFLINLESLKTAGSGNAAA